MAALKTIHLVGAGVAGLALASSLSRRGIPVCIHESGTVPRPRPCGEFVCGVRPKTLNTLGLGNLFQDAIWHQKVTYFREGQAEATFRLPWSVPALGRPEMETAMLQCIDWDHAELRTGERQTVNADREATVWTNGKALGTSPWIGLKSHIRLNETIRDGLEMHVGQGGYFALCHVGNGVLNTGGLFLKREISGRDHELLIEYVRACLGQPLADRLVSGEWVDRMSSIAGIRFGFQDSAPGLSLGDRFAVIPQYTGNGISMAFEGAELAVKPLEAYSRGNYSWAEVARIVTRRARRKFRRRLRWAIALHPWSVQERWQQRLRDAARLRLFPFRLLFSLMH